MKSSNPIFSIKCEEIVDAGMPREKAIVGTGEMAIFEESMKSQR
jgi:hypothetical protein